MGRSCFLTVVLVSALLSLSFSHGNGRKVPETIEEKESVVMIIKEKSRIARQVIELLDYDYAGPNVNTKSGMYCPPFPAPPPGRR